MTHTRSLSRAILGLPGVMLALGLAVILWRRSMIPEIEGSHGVMLDAALLVCLILPLWFGWMRDSRPPRDAAGAAPRRRGARAVWTVAVLLAIGGMLITSVVVQFERQQLASEARARFERQSELLAADLKRRVTLPVFGLYGARAAFASRAIVNREEFRSYVAARDLPKEFPGVLAFGFVKCVEPDRLDEFVARERADGAPDFTVKSGEWTASAGRAARPIEGPERLFVVSYLDPLEPNRAAWGLEVGADPERRASIERAVSNGQASITGRIALVQDQQKGAGFVYMLPVFHPGAAVTTPAERWAALAGLVIAPIRLDAALAGLEEIAQTHLDFEIFDGQQADKSAELFDFDAHLESKPGVIDDGAYAGRMFRSERRIRVADRQWTLVTSSTPAFEATINRSPLVAAALGGMALTGLLAALAWSLCTSRERAFDLAESMTAELVAAKASADRLAEIARRTSNAVVITDSHGLVEWVNEGFTRISGYTLEEVRGKKPGHVLQGPKSDPEAARRMGDAVRDAAAIKTEIINYSKSGHEYRLAIEILPLRDERGSLNGFMAIESDITEQHAAREAAEAANRAKSAFLANMSHEIRTPLTAILGFADVLREEEGSDSREARLATIDTIRRAGAHLLTVINDILDLSKIEADKMTVERVETPLTKIVREVESMMSPRAAAKGVSLSARLATGVPDRILSDPTRLRQMLINLVGNAVKFTDHGSVAVVVRATGASAGAQLMIDVEDTGTGMTPEQASRLFQVFVQADDTVTRRFGGTGLGLTICRRLCTLMGGEVRLLRTEVGKGSCFRLTLPLEPARGAAIVDNLDAVDDLAAPRDPCVRLRGRVLLAEDGFDNQRLIEFHLKNAGAEVQIAGNGRVALDMIEAAEASGQPFDLLLTDMQMPEMDGYTLARHLRRRGLRLPIVALTAHAMAEDRERCLDAGCDDYATKPIDKNALLDTCRRWLGTGSASAPDQQSRSRAA